VIATHTVYIGIGANLVPADNIPAGLRRLAASVRIEALSTFYETEPIGRPGQPKYYNGVCRAATGLEPRRLLNDILHPIEAAMGRVRTADRYAARPLDLDLLLWDDAVRDEPGLRLPHPEILARPFVALLLLELDPHLRLPGHKRPLAEEAANLTHDAMRPLPDFSERLSKELIP
jgi:2-amino-4-hydroxy-6-hydroxymethyldihydropteridine diphosphokinase